MSTSSIEKSAAAPHATDPVNTENATGTIDSETLRRWLADGDELAVLDIRPGDVVGYASPLFAPNLPAERVAAEIDRFVPRKLVRTVLVDGGDGAAGPVADELAAAGRTEVYVLTGGIPEWTREGTEDLPTFDVPGLTFSLGIRDERETPSVTAAELEKLTGEGADVVVIDTRTLPEFTAGHVPGAVGVPGAELLLRFADVVPSPDTHVVVSCAELPRAIIGAQTLIDAGVPNKVSYLHEGTKAWKQENLELETGATAVYGPVDEAARERAAERVRALSADDEFDRVTVETAQAWAADPDRTTYLLDVRTPEEFAQQHLPGSINAEGGQLLGVSYRTIAVRGARVVLIDDLTAARASVVAHWLQHRGFEIALLLHDFGAQH
ncbi:Thiosulfate sulfurtransferase GlpE [Nocardia cerradoensis]|uniref:Thiosulfate sulfurtransferase GlpE n=1 Tax=Nocardia cerradoensis TaxID=85688 RepID=A0A231HDX1_9NOCA|nr:rhodanese-like domain-containing protein [Nocardia cerradoensis]OXR46907.1 Thiosulfate sulfurtransferase GlpE [Nocardia cerradoensis]